MTNQVQTGSDAATYRFPHSAEEVLLDEPEVIEAPRPIEHGDGLRAYEEHTRELHEEASRLALSSVGSYRAEVAPVVEYETPQILHELNRITRTVDVARELAIVEYAATFGKIKQAKAQLFGGVEGLARIEMKEEERKMAFSLLDGIEGVPTNQRWNLHPDQGDWWVERSMIKNAAGEPHPPYSSVHYKPHAKSPTGMIKIEMRAGQDKLNDEIVSLVELTALVIWAQKYHDSLEALPQTIQAQKTAKRNLFK